ncbi:protein diaphanous homolog 3 [Leucoraja erinacea]|uniref:protein diaphanous homolog 3 n=1 Tax=Leucoraja erinaceus TaxID=7782 RepID=UPI002454E21F|nr:protein diaphanous homolog 3 [Leucoraja erinacea]
MNMTVATKCAEALKLCSSPFTPVLDTNSVPLPNRSFLMAPPASPPPPPPPPPPLPPPPPFSESTSPCLLQKSKLRKVNWITIPKEKILGKDNIWTADKYDDDFQLDTSAMEELFEQVLNVSVNKQNSRQSFRSSCPYRTSEKVYLLDSRRSMNVGIFLKQFKRSVKEIVEDIRHGTTKGYGSEELTKLLKLLPEAEEVKHLKMFQGDENKLPEADLFMLLLVRVPSYCLHLEAMILKEEFEPQVQSLLASVSVLMEAAHELQNCHELHTILRLVLKAGNLMNAGGYSGNAAGFRIASLLKLADIKANKPGMNLMHFVAMEAGKKDKNLLSFPDKLEHIGEAARLSEDGLTEELNKLEERLDSLQTNLHEDPELEAQITSFLQTAKKELKVIWEKMKLFQKLRNSLVEYFCEDEKFKVEEYCIVLKSFCEKFQTAIQENTNREIAELRRQQMEKKNAEKRHSIAICSTIENELGQDELERALSRNLRHQSMRRWNCKSFKQDTSSLPHWTKTPHASGEVAQIDQERDTSRVIKDFHDTELADLMRKVSAKVLNQQLCVMQRANPVPKESVNILNQEPETIKETEKSEKEPTASQQTPPLSKDYSKPNGRTMCSTPTKRLKSNENIVKKSKPSHCSKWKRESLERNEEQSAAAKGKRSNQSLPTAKKTYTGVKTSVHQKDSFDKANQQWDTGLNKDNRQSLITIRTSKVNNNDPNSILAQEQKAIHLGDKEHVSEKFSPRPTLTQRNLQAPKQRQSVTSPVSIKQMSSIKEKQEGHQVSEKETLRIGRKSIQSQKEKFTSSQATSPITGAQNQSEAAKSDTRNLHAKQSMPLKKPNSEQITSVKPQSDSLTYKGAADQSRPLKKSRQPVWR